MESLLELDGFGVSFFERVVLSEVSLQLPQRGMTVLVGPAGAGKSTLLRTLCGFNDAHPSMRTWGTALFRSPSANGAVVPSSAMVMQNARMFLDTVREILVSALPERSSLTRAKQDVELRKRLLALEFEDLLPVMEAEAVDLPLATQRRAAIARALIGNAPLLFADEVTAGLDGPSALAVIAALRNAARQMPVVFVTHNQRHALAAGGHTILLASGRVQEATSTAEFYAAPQTQPGRAFVQSGRCLEVTPGTPAVELDDRVTPVDAPSAFKAVKSHTLGPRGFFWVKPGKLGGLPRPGLIDRLEHDARALQRLGITKLITLEESPTVDPKVLGQHGISVKHVPIPDMQGPRLDQAKECCQDVSSWLSKGDLVALHCLAGLGRTGTMLACQLIAEGRSAREALEQVRSINPRCVQSDAQVQFLKTFEKSIVSEANTRNAHNPPRGEGDKHGA